ncbi:MAG: hypothetical protein IPM29_31125 [Planctomycetes bacterium]|nr:hypothetical protein [Planctomycetota bacterium]
MHAARPERGVERGSALLLSLFLVLVLAGLSSALVSTSLFRQSTARALQEHERAYERALAALDVALFELNTSSDTGTDGIGNVAATIAGGDLQVVITPPFAGPAQYTLQVVGGFGPAREGLRVVVATDAELSSGLFGRDSIAMSGGFSVDSYHSGAGTYASQVSGDHAGETGHITSNGDITAGGGIVYGDATPGPGFQVLHPEKVMGATAPAAEARAIDPYVYVPPIGSSGPWTGAGSISTGTYRYDTLTLGSSDVLTINGDVTLYVDDKFTASGSSAIVLSSGATLTIHHGASDFTVSGGGVINPDEAPSRLALFSASLKKLTLSGGAAFFGQVYAPEAEFVSSGGSHLYGSFVTRRANLSGDGGLHFDTSLGAGSAAGGFRVRFAQEAKAL